ncbi:MAG: DUF6526 family protein [Gemmatimonadaceae bacterium]
MAEQPQTYASHKRYIPHFHFFVLPVLLINVIVAAIRFWQTPRTDTGWPVVVAIALLIGLFTARSMALRAQDRIIRLEERVRLERLLPSDLRGRIDELSAGQLIALRFAPDDEVPELTRRALGGELKRQSDIKRAITNWRADHLRV